MRQPNRIVAVPNIVRVKAGALDRLGLYLQRLQFSKVVVLQSAGLVEQLVDRARQSFREFGIQYVDWIEVDSLEVQGAVEIVSRIPSRAICVAGIGGGKALDVAKYVASLAGFPYFSVPTSLSNDGFCSPQSSLTIEGVRRSLPANLPFGLVVDTEVCRQAPLQLYLSGVGDLVAKFTAVHDWKLAFHNTGEPVDDFAALLSDSSVHAFISHPILDASGIRLLATALMMNGMAMAMCGSSRPASGSEHLISHALDRILKKPRLHGLQVGVATYLISLLQGINNEKIDRLFNATGFWEYVAQDPFPRSDWLEAVVLARNMKKDFFTVLGTRDVLSEVEHALAADSNLKRVIV